MLGLPLAAPAAEWSLKPVVNLTTGYNSNIRLAASEHTPVWESTLAPAATFGVATLTDGLSADAGVNIRRFTGGTGQDSGSVLNREDYHLSTNAYHKTELNTLQLWINYTRDSTLDTQLDNGVITTGLATRESLVENPSWTSQLSPRMQMDLSLRNNTVRYRNGVGASNLVDYDYRTATASLSYQITPLTQGLLSGGYSSYLPANGFDSTTLSLLAGFGTSFSETLQATIQAGERQQDRHRDNKAGRRHHIGGLHGECDEEAGNRLHQRQPVTLLESRRQRGIARRHEFLDRMRLQVHGNDQAIPEDRIFAKPGDRERKRSAEPAKQDVFQGRPETYLEMGTRVVTVRRVPVCRYPL